MLFSTCTKLCKHHYNPFLNIFITPRRNTIGSHFLFSFYQLQANLNLFSVPVDIPVLNISYKWNNTTSDFYNCLISLCIMFLRFIHIVAYINISLFLMAVSVLTYQYLHISTSFFIYGWILFRCRDIPYFINPFINWWAFWLFQGFVYMNYASMRIHVQVFMWTQFFISLGWNY